MPGVSRRMTLSFLSVDVVVVLALLLCVVGNFNMKKSTNMRPAITNVSNDVMEVTNKIKVQHNSVDLVPHQVYFDARKPGSSYSNVTVVSISVNKKYRDSIVGCEIDAIQSSRIQVVDIALSGFVARYFPVTHTDCFLYCFDMKVNENSEVNVLYRRNGTVVKEPVRSGSVVIPRRNVQEKDEVMVCAAGFGTVPYLDQWLTYQKSVGIKFIHINIDPSFLQNFNRSSMLVEFVKSGFVKTIVWKDYLNSSQTYYYSQSLKYHDCTLRYQGIYKYMLVIDFDEYFVPFDNNITVLSYAKKIIVGNVGSVVLARQDYCKIKTIELSSLPSDGNMTKMYDTNISYHPNEGKSLHLMKSINQASVHRAELLPNYKLLNYRDSPKAAHCYFAHLTRKQVRFRCRK